VLTHLDARVAPHGRDVSDKALTVRVRPPWHDAPATLQMITCGEHLRVFAVARIAGIQAKKTSDLIPLVTR
jgi:molybdenum cofactor biosynthesis enzyme